RQQPALDDIGEAPTVRLGLVAPRRYANLATRHLGSEEFDTTEWLRLVDAKFAPGFSVLCGVVPIAPPVDEEQIKTLDVEDYGEDDLRIRLGWEFSGTSSSPVKQLFDDKQ